MAWKQRGRKKYLYLIRRDKDGRVRTQYVGAGPHAVALADQLEARKADRRQKAQELKSVQQEIKQVVSVSRQISREVSLLASAMLVVSGYYCHRRMWRKRGRQIA